MGREYPDHPWPSCHALVVQDDAILLVERLAEPLRGYWGLPGGAVELGETVSQALVREVQEETGLCTEIERLLGFRDAIQCDPAGQVQYHFVVFFFLARVVGGELRAGDDAGQARWIEARNVHDLRITDSVEQCLLWLGDTKGNSERHFA